MKLPLAEHFHSIQGEGLWSGTPMHFLRLAGCSVGKAIGGPALRTGKPAWQCHTHDGRPFWCDTDFHKYTEADVQDLVAETFEDHICLTGGEPLIHTDGFDELRHACFVAHKRLHVETSGTITPWWTAIDNLDWLTVSPKAGVTRAALSRANEVKILIDERVLDSPTLGFAPDLAELLAEKRLVFLQPINLETTLHVRNLNVCLELLQLHPSWRLSVQLHKLLGLR